MDSFLLVGTIRGEGSLFYNSATLISRKSEATDSYDKFHLVPFGEYVPFEKHIPFFRGLIDKPIGDFASGEESKLLRINIERKTESEASIRREVNFYKFGTLICFEDIFPEISRNFVKQGASFLVNMTNDAWFGKTSAPYQHVQSSVFRAVENRVPVVRAANTGVSCFINQYGKIFSVLRKDGTEIFVEGVDNARIFPSKKSTIYTKYGDLFCYISIFLFFILLLRQSLKSKKR